MQVFLIPIGGDRYEPYFEPPDGEPADEPVATGWFGRLRRRFSEMLREAEEERHRRHEPSGDPAPHGAAARWRRRLMRWIVERAAEQRLLWHLRTATHATLHVPDDLPGDDALPILLLGLRRDADRHRALFALHLMLLIVSGVFFFIPGPNLIGYFFTFTTVGHLLAWRGATSGLRRVSWAVAPSPELRDLRLAEAAPAGDREARIHAAAKRLGLRHLATFVERLAAPSA